MAADLEQLGISSRNILEGMLVDAARKDPLIAAGLWCRPMSDHPGPLLDWDIEQREKEQKRWDALADKAWENV